MTDRLPVVMTKLVIPEQVVFVHDPTGRTISLILRPEDDDDATRRAIARRRRPPDD